MHTVETYERIRRAVVIEGLSQRAAASELGHSRKTVKKALEHSIPPGYRRSVPVKRPALDSFTHIIDTWLNEDKARHRKQRHTGQRIWQRLVDEHGFTGSASAVRRYIKSRKRITGEVFFPLVFDPGEEAQMDWGEASFVLNGVETKAHYLLHAFMLQSCRLCLCLPVREDGVFS